MDISLGPDGGRGRRSGGADRSHGGDLVAHVAGALAIVIHLRGVAGRAHFAGPAIHAGRLGVTLNTGYVIGPLVLRQRAPPVARQAVRGGPVVLLVTALAPQIPGAHERGRVTGGARQVGGGMRPVREVATGETDRPHRCSAGALVAARAGERL